MGDGCWVRTMRKHQRFPLPISGFLPISPAPFRAPLFIPLSCACPRNTGISQHLTGAPPLLYVCSLLSLVVLNAIYMPATLPLSSEFRIWTSDFPFDSSAFMSQKHLKHVRPKTECFLFLQTNPAPGSPVLVNGTSICPVSQNRCLGASLAPDSHEMPITTAAVSFSMASSMPPPW